LTQTAWLSRGLAISCLTLDTLIKMAKPAEAGTELENILYETGQLFDLLLVTERLGQSSLASPVPAWVSQAVNKEQSLRY